MDTGSILAFLGLVALGSYVQTVSGFAIALIVNGGATALGLVSLAFSANVVSIVALANIGTAVWRHRRHIDQRILRLGAIGVAIFSGPGLLLLDYLSSNAVNVLELLLGIAILFSGALLMMRPQPLQQASGTGAHLLAGGFGGFLSGMFGAGGPPLIVHLYRQPLPFVSIRTTLLAILGSMAIIRLGLESIAGHITLDILELSLLSVPVSILATIAGQRYPPPVSEMTMRRAAFGLLCLLGLSLVISKF